VVMFQLHFSGLCFSGLFRCISAGTWVDLTWFSHSDLYEGNAVSSKMIVYVSKIILSCF